VRAHRPMDTTYYSGCNFYYTATPAYPNRARHIYSDTVIFNPMSPTGTTAYTLSQHANTWLVVEDAEFAQQAILQGHVYIAGSSPPVPIVGATVNLTERVSTTTNADGFYQFTFWSGGTHDATVTKTGYYPGSATGLVLTPGTTVTQNFNLVALPQVTVSGIITANDAPLGLEGAAITLTGPNNYNTLSGPGGAFSIPNVYGHTSGVNYTLTVTMDGYETSVSPIVVYSSDVNAGTINLIEFLWPAYNLDAVETIVRAVAVDLTWEPAGPPPTYSFDFEADNGGWVPSATWGTPPVGDWQWTNTWTPGNFVASENPGSCFVPPAATSGTGLWGTKLYTNYSNSGGASYLTQTFDLTGFENTVLTFQNWNNSNNSVGQLWDYGQVRVNGTVVWGPNWQGTNPSWQNVVIPLSAYDGLSEVTIRFEHYATTVVSYAGWYIDDIYIGPAARFTVNSPSRVHVGYDVYRFASEDEGTPGEWTLLAEDVAGETYRDNTWQAASPGDYKWAVLAIYSADLASEPVISNELERTFDTVDHLVIGLDAGDAVLSWTAVPGAVAYLIYAADDPEAVDWDYLNWTADTSINMGAADQAAQFYYVRAYIGVLPPVRTAIPVRISKPLKTSR